MKSFPTESQYDPMDNPRNPEIEDPEETGVRIAEEQESRDRLRVLHQMMTVFQAEGWGNVDADLATAEDSLNTQLVAGDSHDPQKDAFRRGQLKTIQQIRDWPNRVITEIHGIKQALPD